MSDGPIRLNVTVQPRSPPINVTVKPPVQLNVEVKQRLTPIQVRVGGPYAIVASAPELGSGSAPVFVHTQSTPAAVWTIPNSLGSRAVVLAVYDDAGRVGIADVIVTDTNTVISFSSPRTGRVDYLRS